MRTPSAAALVGLLLLSGASSARAELAVLADGRVLKVESYEVQGERVRFGLPAGGRLTISLDRVERIVDDEIVPEEERIEETTGFELSFREDDEIPDTPYGDLILEAARRHDVSAPLIAAMVRAESAYDSRAISVKGARGLMQLMPATAERFGVARHEIHDPERNLEGGVRYLKWLSKRFDGDLPRMLAGYNAGEGTVDRYGGVPPFRETTTYIKRIFRFLGLEEPTEALTSSG